MYFPKVVLASLWATALVSAAPTSSNITSTNSTESVDSFAQSVGLSSSQVNGASQQRQSTTSFACNLLRLVQSNVCYARGNGTEYDRLRDYNWSPTAWGSPACIFSPRNVQEVQSAIRVLGFTGAKYAIRSGGHSPFKGFANINDGVLISMDQMLDLSYDAKKEAVRFGVGNKWGQIYQFAETHDRLVVGGRIPAVGSALVAGGGLSHFSNRHGFPADNVISFDVVLADGRAVKASANSNSDLFWALKGGSSNFAIITHITLQAYDYGKVWGGMVTYNNSYQDQMMAAFATFQEDGQLKDPDSAVLTYLVQNNDTIIAMYVNLAGVAKPPAFKPFDAIPAISDTRKTYDNFTALISTFTAHYDVPRWTWVTTTLYLDKKTYVDIAKVCEKYAKRMNELEAGTFMIMPQPISKAMIDGNKSNWKGSRSYDLRPRAQLWFTLNIGWDLESDDELAFSIIYEALAEVEKLTKQRKLYDPFQFLNDAGANQKVFQSYGDANHKKLQGVSRKYDPFGMFQRQVPGGFKVFA